MHLGTNFNEILIEIQTSSVKKALLKMASAEGWRFCSGLNVWTHYGLVTPYGVKKTDSTKPLPEPMLTDNKWGFVALPDGNYTGNVHDILDKNLRIINSRLQLHPPRANELLPHSDEPCPL